MATEDAGPSGEPITRVEFARLLQAIDDMQGQMATLKRDLAHDSSY